MIETLCGILTGMLVLQGITLARVFVLESKLELRRNMRADQVMPNGQLTSWGVAQRHT